MANLFTRKEINWWLIFQWVTLVVSLFAALMAYNASLSSAKLSWELNKNNEIETRIYEQRYELYKLVGDALSRFSNSAEKNYLENAKILRDELKRIGYQIRVIGTPYIICNYQNLLTSIDSYVDFVEKESPAHAYADYWRDIIPVIFLFEKSVRDTLLQTQSVDLELVQSPTTEWFYDLNWGCTPGHWNYILEDQYR